MIDRLVFSDSHFKVVQSLEHMYMWYIQISSIPNFKQKQ
jgi:hypothetical protein